MFLYIMYIIIYHFWVKSTQGVTHEATNLYTEIKSKVKLGQIKKYLTCQ